VDTRSASDSSTSEPIIRWGLLVSIKLSQRVLQVDDLVQPGPEQIVRYRHLMRLWPYRVLYPVRLWNHDLDGGEIQTLKAKLEASDPSNPRILSQVGQFNKNRILISCLTLVHAQLFVAENFLVYHAQQLNSFVLQPATH